MTPAVLQNLDNFLNAASPEMVYWLTNTWQTQGQAVTYKELREACLGGFEPLIQEWQDDYANFVNEKLQPIWLDAMKAGAEQIAAKYDITFDTTKNVRDHLQKHGAEFVTVVSEEARAAIRAILAKGQYEQWSVDRMARAIRPTIGLNKPQAVANANYQQHVYEQTLKNHPKYTEAKAAKMAEEAALKYAAQQHRYRAYLIANTELAFAYNVGQHEGVRQAMDEGLMGSCKKIWTTAADHRVCPVCQGLSGAELGFDEKFSQLPGVKFSSKSPDIVPPAHPGCRCAISYEETAPPVFKPVVRPEPQQTWNGKPPADIPEPPAAQIPSTVKMPKGMKDAGKVQMGNTGEMHSCVDASGKEWLFKPAVDKGGSLEMPFRAHIQEAAAKVQGIVDPETAVKVGTGTIGGKFGAFQEKLPVSLSNYFAEIQSDMLMGFPPSPTELKGVIKAMQREHVTDWLLGNFDAHGGNFVLTKDGKIIGIDKEQSFKYIADAASHKMSIGYHPNKKYGETESVYNTFFRAFAEKKIDISLQDSLAYIKRVEAIPDAQYREIFRGYAEALKGKGKTAEQLLDQIVERKQTLRETYREFYSDLLTVRTGKKQKFVFADEVGGGLKQPMAAQLHDPAVLAKMNVAELKQMAKVKKIPHYSKMKKAELIEAISDPAKAQTVSQHVGEQLDTAKAARAAKPRAAAAAKPKKPPTMVNADELFKDPSIIPIDRQGIAIRSDGDKIEGLNLTARREVVGGQEYYCVYGKLADGQWMSLSSGMKRMGAKSSKLALNESDPQGAIFYKNKNQQILSSMNVPTQKLQTAHGTIELVDIRKNGYNALTNFFTIRVPVGPNAASDLQSLMKNVDAKWIMETPTAAEELLLKKRRALWVRSPQLSGDEIFLMSERELDALLKKKGITAKAVEQMKLEEVWKGYATYIDDALIKEAKNAGVEYIWSGVTRDDAVVSILESGGLACTKNRCIMGNAGNGASMADDFESGGADSVFTRIGVKTNRRFNSCFCGYGYRIKIDRSVLGRTDWYAYEEDSFGTTEKDKMKRKRRDLGTFVADMKRNYKNGNEIMFRNGIRTDKFIGINCDSEKARRDLLNKLKQAGIKKVNGIPVEKFVTVEEKIGY